MKKLLALTLLIITCSLITEQYLHLPINKSVYLAETNPLNFPNQYSEEHNDSHEYVAARDKKMKLCIIELSEIKLHHLWMEFQDYCNKIWQPPECKV